MVMPELARLIEGNGFPELAFVEREGTPEPAMKLGIQLHLAGLSLSDTVSALTSLGVDRCRTTVHNLIQKANLQPAEGRSPDHVAVDETVIQVNDQRFWLFAAIDPATSRLLVAISASYDYYLGHQLGFDSYCPAFVDSNALSCVRESGYQRRRFPRDGLGE